MSLNRFYELAEIFNDDERLMAHAIINFTNCKTTAEKIYCDLLDCEYNSWIPFLDEVVNKVTHTDLQTFIAKTSKSFKKGMWAKGDEVLLTERAWKLKTITKPKTKKVKKPEVKMRRQTTIFDFLGV